MKNMIMTIVLLGFAHISLAQSAFDAGAQAANEWIAQNGNPFLASIEADWEYSNEEDAITGIKTISLLAISLESSNVGAGNAGMVFRCTEGEAMDAFINWGEYVENSQIAYRFGTEDAETDSFIESTDNEATFFEYPREILSGMIRAANSERKIFAARVLDVNSDEMTATWKLTNFYDEGESNFFVRAAEEILTQCGIDEPAVEEPRSLLQRLLD